MVKPLKVLLNQWLIDNTVCETSLATPGVSICFTLEPGLYILHIVKGKDSLNVLWNDDS